MCSKGTVPYACWLTPAAPMAVSLRRPAGHSPFSLQTDGTRPADSIAKSHLTVTQKTRFRPKSDSLHQGQSILFPYRGDLAGEQRHIKVGPEKHPSAGGTIQIKAIGVYRPLQPATSSGVSERPVPRQRLTRRSVEASHRRGWERRASQSPRRHVTQTGRQFKVDTVPRKPHLHER